MLCPHTNDIRFLQIAASGAAAAETTLGLPPIAKTQKHEWIAGGVLSPNGNTLAVVTGDGRILVVDTSTQRISRTVDLRRPADSMVAFGTVAGAPDGSRLYIGAGPIAERGHNTINQVLMVHTRTWRQLGTITTTEPFWSLAVSHDGRRLYTINREGRTVVIADTATRRETGTINGIGEAPAVAIVAP